MNSKEKTPLKVNEPHKKGHKPGRGIIISVGAVIIFLLAAVSFLVLPAIVPSGSGAPVFGKYDGKPIEYAPNTYFTSMVQYYSDQLKQQGQTVDFPSGFNIYKAAFSSAVIQMAYTDAVNKSGYIVPESLIDRTLLPYFYDQNGVYSQKLYANTPDSTKIAMRKDITAQLTAQQYYTDVFGTGQASNFVMYGLKQSSKEVPFIVEMGKNKRSFDIAAFPIADYPKEEIIAFGKENSGFFVSHNLSVVTLSTKKEAENILSRITKGQVLFDDAAVELSAKTYAGDSGKLINSYNYQLQALISNEAQLKEIIDLHSGDISGVVETDESWSIFRCDGASVEPDFENQTLVQNIYSYMRASEAGKIEDYFINRGKDFAASAAKNGFDTACREFGLTKTVTPDFPLNYGNNPLISVVPSDTEPALTGAQNNDVFLRTAFSLRPNEISSPILLGQNVLVLKVAAETEEDASMGEIISMIYPGYAENFDQTVSSTFFLSSKKVEDNVLSVYLKYFMPSSN